MLVKPNPVAGCKPATRSYWTARGPVPAALLKRNHQLSARRRSRAPHVNEVRDALSLLPCLFLLDATESSSLRARSAGSFAHDFPSSRRIGPHSPRVAWLDHARVLRDRAAPLEQKDLEQVAERQRTCHDNHERATPTGNSASTCLALPASCPDTNPAANQKPSRRETPRGQAA